MNSKKTAKKIFDLLGGKENIISNATCMTRLRIKVKRTPDLEKIKKIDGVINVVEADTLQIIIGPGIVNHVGNEFSKLSGIPLGFSQKIEEEKNSVDMKKLSGKDSDTENMAVDNERHNRIIQRFLQKTANIFIPLLPGIIAAGLITGITNSIDIALKGQLNNEWWFLAIRSAGFAMFGYLSLYVGMNSAKEFGGTPILGGIIGSIFITDSALPLFFQTEGKNIISPFTGNLFSNGAGGIMTALFMGIIVAYIEKNVRKITHPLLDTFLTPLITLIIGVLIAILIVHPVGETAAAVLFKIMNFIDTELGIIGGYIIAAGFLPFVSTGFHQALIPVHVLLNNPYSPTGGINYLLPILITAGGGQVGGSFALFLKTENKKLKKLLGSLVLPGILGMGEPLMYGIMLPLGKPFITSCLGAGFGGALSSFFHLGSITQGVSGILGILTVVPGTWTNFLIAMSGAYLGGFILTYLFGVNHERIEKIYGK